MVLIILIEKIGLLYCPPTPNDKLSIGVLLLTTDLVGWYINLTTLKMRVWVIGVPLLPDL